MAMAKQSPELAAGGAGEPANATKGNERKGKERKANAFSNVASECEYGI